MKSKTKFFAYLAVFSALTFVTTIAIAIPVPATSGYINFGDTVIFVASATIGPLGGMLTGGIGSMLADLVYAPYWAPFTLLIKGFEGLFAGLIFKALRKRFSDKKWNCAVSSIIAFITAAMEMVIGYYACGGLLTGLLNENNFTVGFAASLSEMPGNLIQGGVSVAVAFALLLVLMQIPYVKSIQSEFLHDNTTPPKL